MGDAPHKRPLEDGDEPGPKKLATTNVPDINTFTPNPGMQGAGVMSETMRLPDDLVGLIIGRAGENIMRMQRETGCRIQITQSIPGTNERPCTLSGTPEQIEVCKNMLSEIVARSKAGTLTNNAYNVVDSGVEKSIEIPIPADKCGLIIGKGGETIKMLQQSLGVKMLLIQDSTENIGQSKPLRITGSQINLDSAVNAVHQMMAQRDAQIAKQKSERDGHVDPSMFNDDNVNKTIIPVPKAAVGVVIGKGGDMINQIQDITGTRVQFKPEDPSLPERMCSIMGSKNGVDQAIQKIHEIIQNVQERDNGMGPMGGMRGGAQGGMGGFGQWEGPNRGRGMGGVTTEEHLVPANKTGLVIGKGGDTIKQINAQSGAHAEIQKNPPPGSDINYKTFLIKGTPEQIKLCRQLIQEKVDAGPGGMNQGGMMRGPPPGNYGPPPPQAGFGGMPPNQFPQQAQLAQPAQPPAFQQQQQAAWGGNQFQQWTPPAVTTPQQNGGAKPVNDANSAAWNSYLQLYGQAAQAQAFQQPAVSAAAPAVGNAVASQPDYSKQWDEYLKQTAAAAAAVAPTGAIAQQVAAAPSAATPAAASAQPATTQADYSAAWAEYYRQYYALQNQQQQQYAAAVVAGGQAPAQT